MRSLRIRVVAADIAVALKQVQDRLMSTAVAAKVKIIANAKNIIMNTVKANAIAMNMLMSIIMTNMLSKPIA